MLELSFKNIQFNGKLIINESELKLKAGKLTILCGPSGSGKSTIIHAVMLQNEFLARCILNQEELDMQNKLRLKQMIYSHISFATQEPEFINDLTVQDHIDMYLELFNFSMDIAYFKRLLDINSLLNKYPMELSGGERKRLGILLAILRNTEILIFDEPNSALDDRHTDCLNLLLQMLLDNNKSLLITTHDEKIMKKADVLYCIDDYNLILEKDKIADTIVEEEKYNENKNNIHIIQKYIEKTYEHHKLYRKMLTVFAVLCVSFCALSTELNDFFMEQHNFSSKAVSNELIIYQPDSGAENDGYQYLSEGKEIEKNQVDQIMKLDGVVQVSYRNDIDLNNESNVASPERYETVYYTNQDYELKRAKEYAITATYKDQSHYDVMNTSVICSTYLDGVDYSSDIMTDFHQDGVYLTPELAECFYQNDMDLKDVTLRFHLILPQYTSKGALIVDDAYKITIPVGTRVPVTMKIAGILKENKMGLPCAFGKVMYMKQSVMQSYVEQYRETQPKLFYGAVKEDENFMEYQRDFYPELTDDIKQHGGYTRFYTIDYQPWEPSAYTVLVDDASHVSKVIKELASMGFSVYSADFDYHSLSDGTKTMQKLFVWFSVITTLIICAVLILMKYNDREKEVEMNRFFEHLGFQKDEIYQIKRRKYNYRARTVFFDTAIVMACMIGIDLGMKFIGLGFHIKPFLVAFCIVALVEYIIPVVIEKRLCND